MTNPVILLVEDNETEQFALSKLIRKFDFESRSVSSGEEALEAIQGTKFAAILMDVKLPAMDGYECTRLIRAYETARGLHTPIIALTGYVQPADRLACIESGMDDFSAKPFNPNELRRILLRWVYDSNRPNLKILSPHEEETLSE